MTNQERGYVDLIIRLLVTYEQYVHQHGDPWSVRFPNIPEASVLRKQIDVALGVGSHSFSIGRVIRGAHDWGKAKIPSTIVSEEQFLALKLLLSTLDLACSDKPVSKWNGSNKQLILGRRFWKVLERYRSENGQGPFGGAHETTSVPYHHLHVMTLGEDEWHEGDAVSTVFTPLRRRFGTESDDSIPLRVGLFTFSKSIRTFFTGTDVMDSETQIHGFRAERVEHAEEGEQGYLQELRECVKWAGNSGLHILIMPELSVCPKGLDVVRDAIAETPNELCLVIPGSYHVDSRKHTGRHANAAPIWVVERGHMREISRYEKRDPFGWETHKAKGDIRLQDVYEKASRARCPDLKEDIASGSEARLISTPFGVIQVVICKDFLFQHASDPYRVADHLLVVSMNDVPDRFTGKAWESVYLCTAVYYANAMQSCHAANAAEAAFWYFPCSIGSSRKVVYYAQPDKTDAKTRRIDVTGRVLVQGIPLPRQMFIEESIRHCPFEDIKLLTNV